MGSRPVRPGNHHRPGVPHGGYNGQVQHLTDTPSLLRLAGGLLGRCPDRGFVAVELSGPGGTVEVDATVPRLLLGWRAAPGSSAAGAAFRTGSAARGHAVGRDGREVSTSEGEDPVLWMLRRALGLPSRARHRRPDDVAMSVVLSGLADLAAGDPEPVRSAVHAGAVRELVRRSPRLAVASAPLAEGATWAELHRRASVRSELSRWCDADLFAHLSGHAVPAVSDAAAELEAAVGAAAAVLARDQLDGPW